jgi:hypothetical protein
MLSPRAMYSELPLSVHFLIFRMRMTSGLDAS